VGFGLLFFIGLLLSHPNRLESRMFTPAEAIAELDAALVKTGQTVTMRRGVAPVIVTATVKAFVRGYKPEELVGTITQRSRKVILSATFRTPLEQQQVSIDGQPFTIKAVDPIKMADVLVRIELQVEGNA
jgi:hypothetical protein